MHSLLFSSPRLLVPLCPYGIFDRYYWVEPFIVTTSTSNTDFSRSLLLEDLTMDNGLYSPETVIFEISTWIEIERLQPKCLVDDKWFLCSLFMIQSYCYKSSALTTSSGRMYECNVRSQCSSTVQRTLYCDYCYCDKVSKLMYSFYTNISKDTYGGNENMTRNVLFLFGQAKCQPFHFNQRTFSYNSLSIYTILPPTRLPDWMTKSLPEHNIDMWPMCDTVLKIRNVLSTGMCSLAQNDWAQ